jgi:KipI family sensor histidine kinase inhibitor
MKNCAVSKDGPESARYPRVLPVGDTAFTVEFGETVDPDLNSRVHALDLLLQEKPLPGVVEQVPTYRSLLVAYDRAKCQPQKLRAALLSLANAAVPNRRQAGRLVEIRVRYGGSEGPDLLDVATHCGLAPDEVVAQHTAPTYQVAMLGFAPGFAYLLGLPGSLSTPRLSTPRLHVPPGSVGIAGHQTGIYALDTPGGWQLIGRTAQMLFDPERERPFLVEAGDRVQFVAVR